MALTDDILPGSSMTLGTLLRSQAGIVVFETIIVACLMFGTFSLLVRVTDMETVGLWVLVNALLGFSRAADFWSRGLGSFVGQARGKGEDFEAAGFVSTAVWSGVAGYALLAVLGASLVWLFAEQLAGAGHAVVVRDIVPLMALTFWLLALSGIYGGAFLAFGKPLLKASQTVGGAVVFLVLAALLAPHYGLWGILVAQALQGGLVLVWAATAFHGFVARDSTATWRKSQFRQLASYGSKALVVGMLQLGIEPVIRLLASQFGGLGAVVAVELASRVITVVRSVITALGQILVPEFARLGAAAPQELDILFRDVNRLFLVASISAFSLLVSAAPALEELVLGRSGTGLVAFLWILSVGWYSNTVTSSAYFLLLGQRRLRPLFWSHLIMTLGAIVLGTAGGLFSGIHGALAGAASAIALSSLYLVTAADEGRGIFRAYTNCLSNEPVRFVPVLVAIASITLLEMSGFLLQGLVARICGHAAVIAATATACLVFGDIRGIAATAARIR